MRVVPGLPAGSNLEFELLANGASTAVYGECWPARLAAGIAADTVSHANRHLTGPVRLLASTNLQSLQSQLQSGFACKIVQDCHPPQEDFAPSAALPTKLSCPAYNPYYHLSVKLSTDTPD